MWAQRTDKLFEYYDFSQSKYGVGEYRVTVCSKNAEYNSNNLIISFKYQISKDNKEKDNFIEN